MGEYKEAAWYDAVYAEETNLTGDVSTFSPLWEKMATLVPDGCRVLELGCGAGQLAALILPRTKYYWGVDFSSVALDHAVKRINKFPGEQARRVIFSSDDLTTDWHPGGFVPDLLIACESFEHLPGDTDLDLLSQFRGTDFIASLPMGNSASHVRHFPGAEHVQERYGDLILDPVITTFDQWHILEGKIK